MNGVLRVALEEWRYWFRSRLAWVGLAVAVILVAGVAGLTATRMVKEAELRLEHQRQAEQRFVAQPARHPHRMVHYGHYVFRQPGPLALVDPGVDAVTGTSLFLEGHRQNTATFAAAQARANTGGLGLLTTALLYQALIPLLLIALGHGIWVRERETGTLPTLLTAGLSTRSVAWGKVVALLSLVSVLMLPLMVVTGISISLGEHYPTALSLLLTYVLYLLVWTCAVFSASALFRQRRSVLAALLGAWLAMTLIVPRASVALTRARIPTVGQLEQNLQLRAEVKKAGNPHDPADPAFAKLRDELFAKYGAERVEDLPVNLRGIVAQKAEAALAQLLQASAEQRMAQESEQAQSVAAFGWLSPAIAVGVASRALAGTDLSTHHRFLREAEALRLDFVQALNKIHATRLSYADDIQRSRDSASERRTRVGAENWSLLRSFRFKLAEPEARVSQAWASWCMLLAWAGLLLLTAGVAVRRLVP